MKPTEHPAPLGRELDTILDDYGVTDPAQRAEIAALFAPASPLDCLDGIECEVSVNNLLSERRGEVEHDTRVVDGLPPGVDIGGISNIDRASAPPPAVPAPIICENQRGALVELEAQEVTR